MVGSGSTKLRCFPRIQGTNLTCHVGLIVSKRPYGDTKERYNNNRKVLLTYGAPYTGLEVLLFLHALASYKSSLR